MAGVPSINLRDRDVMPLTSSMPALLSSLYALAIRLSDRGPGSERNESLVLATYCESNAQASTIEGFDVPLA